MVLSGISGEEIWEEGVGFWDEVYGELPNRVRSFGRMTTLYLTSCEVVSEWGRQHWRG